MYSNQERKQNTLK